MISCLVVFDGR